MSLTLPRSGTVWIAGFRSATAKFEAGGASSIGKALLWQLQESAEGRRIVDQQKHPWTLGGLLDRNDLMLPAADTI